MYTLYSDLSCIRKKAVQEIILDSHNIVTGKSIFLGAQVPNPSTE